MDEIHRPKYECRIYDSGHVMQLDQSMTTSSKTVFSCPCGATQEENEDAGTGA